MSMALKSYAEMQKLKIDSNDTYEACFINEFLRLSNTNTNTNSTINVTSKTYTELTEPQKKFLDILIVLDGPGNVGAQNLTEVQSSEDAKILVNLVARLPLAIQAYYNVTTCKPVVCVASSRIGTIVDQVFFQGDPKFRNLNKTIHFNSATESVMSLGMLSIFFIGLPAVSNKDHPFLNNGHVYDVNRLIEPKPDTLVYSIWN